VTLQALLLEAGKCGIRLSVAGDKLKVQAPAGALTAAIRDALTRHKAAIMRRLATPECVMLKGGLAVPVASLQLAWNLEERGFGLHVDSDNHLKIEPDDALTDADRAAIRRWDRHLAAIAAYEAPEVA
jgi:predicted metal-dependent hydrolase